MSPTHWPQPDLKFTLAVGPGIDAEAWRLSVPAKPGCYLLTNEAGTPILLGTAANMRHVLVHRLTTPPDEDEPTKRIDYRQVVRKIHYRPAFSRFEVDWSYIANSRRHYPDQTARLTRKWSAHWVHVDLAERFPRFAASRQPPATGECFGPLPTANAARTLVETVTDLFDLCRYHEILRQSPQGQACAYKEMGKCPAPCDGSVTLESYGRQLQAAHAMLLDLPGWIAGAEQRMAAAARELKFEQAGQIKSRIERAGNLLDAKYAAFAPMAHHRYLLLQPGSRKHHARAFVARADAVVFLGEITKRDRDRQVDWLCDQIGPMLEEPLRANRDDVGLLSWHLLRGQKETGVWLEAGEAIRPDAVAAAIDRLATDNSQALTSGGDTDSDEQPGTDDA